MRSLIFPSTIYYYYYYYFFKINILQQAGHNNNGGGEESRQVRNFWREVQRRSVENPVRFSQIKFTSPTKPFFHGWTFHLAASMSEAIQAERCLSEDECSCLIKSLGGKILSESEDDMEVRLDEERRTAGAKRQQKQHTAYPV